MLLDSSPRWHILHALVMMLLKLSGVPLAIIAIITKDFKKSSLLLQKVGACPVFISFLHQTHFTFRLYFCCRSILETLLPHLEAEKTCARRARD